MRQKERLIYNAEKKRQEILTDIKESFQMAIKKHGKYAVQKALLEEKI